MIFRSYSEDWVLNDSWEKFAVLSRSWAFNGDWFAGILANLHLYMGLIKKTQVNSDISFFHPRAFEHAIGVFLTNQFSTHEINGMHNWKVVNNLPCVAAYLEVTPREEMRNNDIQPHPLSK